MLPESLHTFILWALHLYSLNSFHDSKIKTAYHEPASKPLQRPGGKNSTRHAGAGNGDEPRGGGRVRAGAGVPVPPRLPQHGAAGGRTADVHCRDVLCFRPPLPAC
jgi:hypothetical protein